MKKSTIVLALVTLTGGLLIYKGLQTPEIVRASNKVSTSKPTPPREPAANKPAEKTKKTTTTQKPPSKTTNSMSQINKKLATLKQCYQSRKCSYSKQDRRSYDYELGQDITKNLQGIRSWIKENPKANFSEAELLAREYIQSTDHSVQRASLELFSLLPTSDENLEALMSGLENTPDPELVSDALNEFKRYSSGQQSDQVHNYLSRMIKNGPQFSSQDTAKNILPFINKESYPKYKAALSSMRPDSIAAKNLRAALEEYERLQEGA